MTTFIRPSTRRQLYYNIQKKLDYLTNSFKTTYPPGMEINLYASRVLFYLEKNINKKSKDREHAIGNFKDYKNKNLR